jgi:putative addiction module component (TIGR02574 family)
MTADEARVVRDALRLPPEARAALAGSLIESLEGAPDPDAEQAWSEEIEKRVRAIDSGETALMTWPEARRRIVGE